MARFTRILSIDGGGIRGIIPGQVLVSVEQKLRDRTGNEGARIADYFDLIAGTSTGGILTCIYLCPSREGDRTRPRFSTKEAVDLYIKRGGKIFESSLGRSIRSVWGLMDERYDAGDLEQTLESYVENPKVID